MLFVNFEMKAIYIPLPHTGSKYISNILYKYYGFNKIKIPIKIDKKLSGKYLKKIGFNAKISDDGNRYLSKGEYILKVDNQELKLSVK